MIPPSELTRDDGEIDPKSAQVAEVCHIYLICRRPATSYDPDSFKFDGSRISGKLVYKIEGKSQELPFDVPFQLLDGAVSVQVSAYPHRSVESCLPNGECVRHVPATLMAAAVAPNGILRQFEVLYVGQAYAEGRRSALDRLKSHSTLQKILADVLHKMPDDEIMLLTFEYPGYDVVASLDGTDKTAIRDETDAARFPNIIDNPLTEHQKICLAEAGLIRYFTPPYNEIYKESFPAADQKILAECYAVDFSALIVEIDTEELGMELYSEKVAASGHHMAKFDLIDPTARRSFFTFVTKDGKPIQFPDVIAPTR
jgi:hypothetical protein